MTLKLLFLSYALFLSFSTHAYSDQALELAKSMQLSEAAHLGMFKALEDGMAKGHNNQSIYDCIVSKGKAHFDEHFATVIENILSPAEMSDGIIFFNSSAGQKYNQIGFSMLLEKLDGKKSDYPKFNDYEKRIYMNFIDTSAGTKLIKDRILDSPEVQASNQIALRTLYNQCSN